MSHFQDTITFVKKNHVMCQATAGRPCVDTSFIFNRHAPPAHQTMATHDHAEKSDWRFSRPITADPNAFVLKLRLPSSTLASDVPSMASSPTRTSQKDEQRNAVPLFEPKPKRPRRVSSESMSKEEYIGCCGSVQIGTKGPSHKYDHFVQPNFAKSLMSAHKTYVKTHRVAKASPESRHVWVDSFDDTRMMQTYRGTISDNSAFSGKGFTHGVEAMGECILCSCAAKTAFLLMIQHRLPFYATTPGYTNDPSLCYFLYLPHTKSLQDTCIDGFIPSELPLQIKPSSETPIQADTDEYRTTSIPVDTIKTPTKKDAGSRKHRHAMLIPGTQTDDLPAICAEDGLNIKYIPCDGNACKVWFCLCIYTNTLF